MNWGPRSPSRRGLGRLGSPNQVPREHSHQVTWRKGMFSRQLCWGFQVPFFFEQLGWKILPKEMVHPSPLGSCKSPSSPTNFVDKVIQRNLVKSTSPQGNCKSLSSWSNLLQEIPWGLDFLFHLFMEENGEFDKRIEP